MTSKLRPASLLALAAIASCGLATGASARPGCSATVYEHINYGGAAWTLNDDVGFVGQRWNDQISSIVVHRGVWVFFQHANYGGATLQYGPGAHSFVGQGWNDQISSARCIQPTG